VTSQPQMETGGSFPFPGRGLKPGDHHYRAFVGPPECYDIASKLQFVLLANLGLREHHYLLDIGCGSLRAGKLFIPFLLPERYYGIEPEAWLIQEGIDKELGQDIIDLKRPTFIQDADFRLTSAGRRFDFLLAQSIFSHASQDQIQRCLSQAEAVMKKSSLFVATFFEGTVNYEGLDWVYPGLVTYTFRHMQQLVCRSGLRCGKIHFPHPAGQTWVLIAHESTLKKYLDP